LSLVEMDLHKADLAIFKSISNYSNPRPPFTEPANGGIIPPLLVAFILDTSDLPNNQALVWNREGSKVTLDSAALGLGNGKGKAREKDHRTGIVLERWTLQAKFVSPCPRILGNGNLADVSALPAADVSSSQMAAHTAYRYGIAHFRALFALVRILPAYRLYRRLRRANTGLRLGIKLWGPEGYMTTPDDLDAAWEVMERDLIPLDVGLEQFITTESVDPATTERYDVPSVDLFGTSYQIGVEYRTEVDFTVEDMESVLSEKFVDMDEDWFTPTVARHRMEDESSRTTSSSGTSVGDRTTGRKVSNPTAIPTNSPIPQRQQAAAPGSFGSIGLGGSRPSGSRLASGGGSGARNVPGSQGSGRWGALAEGLPFGAPSPGAMDGRVSPRFR
jgi:autophagy-related protein 13